MTTADEGAPNEAGSVVASSKRTLLDRTFTVSIVLKGLDGVVEMVGGLLLLVVSPESWNNLALDVTRHELSQDPNDYIANHLLHATGDLAQTRLFGALYLLSHGAVKIVLVIALLKRQWWAYPVSIVFLVAFIAYQAYRIAVSATIGMIALTLFDVFVTWLVWREYQLHRRGEHRATSTVSPAQDSHEF